MRVVTFNTWKNAGDYPRRLRAMIAGLQAVSADVILLQETFRTGDGTAHTAQFLADALHMECSYAPARFKLRRWDNREVPSESGLAILARGPITWSERLLLPSDEAGGERIALLAALVIDGAPIVAGCMHLSHLRGDHARRREQLETILAQPIWSVPAALCVLGGDANATTDSPALDWLEHHPSLTIQSVTAPNLGPTYPLPPRENRPGRVIDHLLTLTPRTTVPPKVVSVGLALNETIDGVFASDHAAVVAEFSTVASALSLATP
jgi:endonuclease/exonuclease/phosphatase family metal-dependent hydrolase